MAAKRISAMAFSLGIMPSSWGFNVRDITNKVPPTAQIIDQKSFNVLDSVPPPSEVNGSAFFPWPPVESSSLSDKPFHIYDDEFYDVIGDDPTLTLLASTDKDPLFHEAVVWNPPTEEVFFVQNAGAPAAGTGLNKSAIIQKISLSDAEAVKNSGNSSRQVTIHTVPTKPQVINPNGGTNYKGQIFFVGEGQGSKTAPTVYLMNPEEPYNTTAIVNNYFGRQFNSLNDIVVHPKTGEIYFTDTQYGELQAFRPAAGLRNSVYRYNYETGALSVVADGFVLPNGLTFSPAGDYAYVTDTGMSQVNNGFNFSDPASIYRYDVRPDGTWENRKTFAYVSQLVPDGVHCDSVGRVYSGCGDGVHVWNPQGKLIGKIFTGMTVANFQFAGKGRMVIMAETKLFYATLGATGMTIT